MPKPLVSIVIPVCNGANYLREAIDSALAQTYPHCEILVVNDGSTDGGATEAIALSYCEQIRYLVKENGGVASALNMGIENMRGDFFSWLSHDDIYLPEKISTQVSQWRAQRSLQAIIVGNIAYIDAEGIRTPAPKIPDFRSEDLPFRLWGESFLNGCSLLIPKCVFETFGQFHIDKPTTQDHDLWLRFACNVPFLVQTDVVVLSRQHSEQDSCSDRHKLECAVLLQEHAPAIAKAANQRSGGAASVMPLLAGAVLSRWGDYGPHCARGMLRALKPHLSPSAWHLMQYELCRHFPYAVARCIWLQIPLRLRWKVQAVCSNARRRTHQLKDTWSSTGIRGIYAKTSRYATRVVRRVRLLLSAKSAQPAHALALRDKSLTVIIDHDAGGGATAYRQRMTERLVQQGHAVLLWQYMVGVGGYLFTWRLQQKERTFRSRHLEQALHFIEAATPEKIFFNNMAGWPRLGDTLRGVVHLCRGSTQLEIFLHDYFMLCPAYQLLDVNGAFCGVPSDLSRCDTCLPCQVSAMAHRGTRIEEWRAMWAAFLDKAQCIIAPDASVQTVFGKVYPNSVERILIVPHSPLCDWLPLPEQKIKKEAVVGVIGNITRPKGAGLVEDLVRLMEQQAVPMRVVVIGVLESSLRHPLLHVTGTYDHDDLPDLLIKHGVSACLVPSPLPETFCYVAQEIEMLGLPLVCLDMGAQAVRARNYVKGLIAPTPDAAGCLQSLRNLHDVNL